jgi:chlorobactene glucosyltransferase
MLLLVSMGWLVGISVLVMVLLLHARGYQVSWWRIPVRDAELPTVTVVVPARDEAENIGRCVAALLDQTYPVDRMRVVVVDDGSTDGTPDIVRRFAAADPRVQLVAAGPLPAGWTGKPHACLRGSQAADSEWLCFVDADTAAYPELLRRAVGLAQHRTIDMLSLVPLQQLHTFWERLVLPVQFLLLALFMDIHRVNDPHSRTAVANGQCILIRRAVYESIGGHAAVCGDVTEDLALARAVKHAGHRLFLISGTGLIRTRMYKRFGEIWRGFSKNTVDLIGGVPNALFGALVMLITGWAPVVLLAGLSREILADSAGGPAGLALALTLLGTGGLLGVHLLMERYNRVPLRYALLFPIGHTMAAALTLNSVRRHLAGRKEWKGRVYEGGEGGTLSTVRG